MLTIRAAQLAALHAATEASFVDAIVSHVRTHFPGHPSCADTETLRARVIDGLAAARSFGITRDADLGRFVNLEILFGPAFPDRPENRWMRVVLADEAVPSASERMHRLYQAVIARQETEAANRRIHAGFESALGSIA